MSRLKNFYLNWSKIQDHTTLIKGGQKNLFTQSGPILN